MFKVGDKVRIVRKVEKEEGWDNVWTEDMTSCIAPNQTREVTYASRWGVTLKGTDAAAEFQWPPGALELVESADTNPHLLKRDDPIMVRDEERDEWKPRHFSHLEGTTVYAFSDGMTSFTADCGTLEWVFWRHPTPEELKGA